MKTVAIVGSGISGLGAAWALSLNKQEFKVCVYEKNPRLGGHSNTVTLETRANGDSTSQKLNVDTGFIVFNQKTYPNFIRFLTELGVAYEKSDMSFAVSVDRGFFEWSGQGLGSLFAQRSNLVSASFYQMLFDIFRFNATATDILHLPDNHPHRTCTIGEYLTRHAYSQAFIDKYLIPMTAAIWSSPAVSCFHDFPAETLVRFMHNHCLLQALNHPQWYTVTNGSINYINKISSLVDEIKLDCEVTFIERTIDGVRITDKNGDVRMFDAVIMAAHGDETLRMLGDPTAQELAALQKVQFTSNRAVLHSDISLMPLRKETWASWNYLTQKETGTDSLKKDTMCLTYWMNKLQNISPEKHGQILVTMNPLWEPESKYAEFSYSHPSYNLDLVKAQSEIKQLNKKAIEITKTVFAGAWLNYGFHEDGLTSGLIAAGLLGAVCPFDVVDATCIRPIQDINITNFAEYLLIAFFRVVNLLLISLSPLVEKKEVKTDKEKQH